MKKKQVTTPPQRSWGSSRIKPWKPRERTDAQLVSFEFVGTARDLRVVIGNTYERTFNIQQQPFTESRVAFDEYLKPTGKFKEI